MAEKPNEKILAFCQEHNTTPGAVLDGVAELVEAAEPFVTDYYGDPIVLHDDLPDNQIIHLTVRAHVFRAFCEALSRMKGGKS